MGINLLWVAPGDVGGSEEYAVRSVLALAAAQDRWHPIVFCRPELIEHHPELSDAVDVVERSLPRHSRVARIVAENMWLPGAAQKARVDVMHHVGGRMPARGGSYHTVLTIHDLQPLEMGVNFKAPKRSYLRWAIPRSVRRADSVIAVSEHVADQLQVKFARAHVVPVPSPFEPVHLRPASSMPEQLVDRPPWPYLLYPAVTHPHKNHRTLLDAIRILASDGLDVLLVSTGGAGSAEAKFHDAVDELGLEDHVVRLGRVDRPILDLLLSKASALAFPSTYEGFGIPLLEAMAANCPIIASNASAVPEVVGDAAVLVPPHEPADWADAIRDVVEGTIDPEELVARGRRQVRRYTRTATAEALDAAYDYAFAAPDAAGGS